MGFTPDPHIAALVISNGQRYFQRFGDPHVRFVRQLSKAKFYSPEDQEKIHAVIRGLRNLGIACHIVSVMVLASPVPLGFITCSQSLTEVENG